MRPLQAAALGGDLGGRRERARRRRRAGRALGRLRGGEEALDVVGPRDAVGVEDLSNVVPLLGVARDGEGVGAKVGARVAVVLEACLLYTSPSPRD